MGAEILVADWVDLRRLPIVMDDVGNQAQDLVGFARRWVAQPDGFDVSPICLLRPLTEALEMVDAAFARLGEEFSAQWEQVRAGVVAAEAELSGAESDTTSALLALVRQVHEAAA